MSKRILIADDSEHVRRVVHTFLTDRDFDVCGEAADGEDAIEKARALKPDLILLDAVMPRKNGIAAASVLKVIMPDVPIVLLTLYSEAIAGAFPPEELPADAVIDKTGGMDRLEECVQNLLDKGEGAQRKDRLMEEADEVRDEVFKRMFPDVPRKSSD